MMMPKRRFWLPVGKYSASGSRARLSSTEAAVSPITTVRRRRVLPVIHQTRLVIQSAISPARFTPPQSSR